MGKWMLQDGHEDVCGLNANHVCQANVQKQDTIGDESQWSVKQ